MFKLKRPCANCPFRKGRGELFGLGKDRLEEIFTGTAFQCHETVNYDEFDDDRLRQGKHPQQCAGVMSLLYREGRSNTIMQVAERFGHFDPDALEHSEVYDTIADAMRAHQRFARCSRVMKGEMG